MMCLGIESLEEHIVKETLIQQNCDHIRRRPELDSLSYHLMLCADLRFCRESHQQKGPH